MMTLQVLSVNLIAIQRADLTDDRGWAFRSVCEFSLLRQTSPATVRLILYTKRSKKAERRLANGAPF